MGKNFTISSFSAQDNFEVDFKQKYGSYLNWPLICFLKDEASKAAYVGETTDVVTRLTTHKNTPKKKALSSVNIILSELFNKSATLDLESNLIRYISADGTYALQNGNLGITNHQYYNQKEVYWDLFKDVWGELQGLGIARHSLEHIDNSDLFKYSPYKSLSKGQVQSLKLIMRCLLNPQQKVEINDADIIFINTMTEKFAISNVNLYFTARLGSSGDDGIEYQSSVSVDIEGEFLISNKGKVTIQNISTNSLIDLFFDDNDQD